MKRRNPILAGFFNALIPGSSHLYVGNNWLKFVLFFVVNSLIILLAILLGNNIQNVREYTLPEGLCTGTLLFGIFAFLFYSGMKMASERNSGTDSAAHYQSMRTPISEDDPVTRLARLQRQRDEGLISSEQQATGKEEIKSKKK